MKLFIKSMKPYTYKSHCPLTKISTQKNNHAIRSRDIAFRTNDKYKSFPTGFPTGFGILLIFSLYSASKIQFNSDSHNISFNICTIKNSSAVESWNQVSRFFDFEESLNLI